MMQLAQAILDTLERCGVDTVFGIPGNHNVELYRYLPESNIRHVTARHEQGAGFMADGYARATGRPGVCFVISGPGVTNVATAMAQALGDSVPMLVIATVGDQTEAEGRLHELPDQLALARQVAVEASQPASPQEAAGCIARFLLNPERPGPHYVQIPLSWWRADVSQEALPDVVRAVPGREELDRAAAMIEEAARPLLLVGGGCQGAADEVRTLAESLAAPVINTVNAKGVLSPMHHLAVGGSPSLEPVRSLIKCADLLIAVGTELGETDYDLLMVGDIEWRTPMIRIDIDANAAQKNVNPAVTLVGDAASTLDALAYTLPGNPRAEWTDAGEVRTACAREPHMHPAFAEVFAAIDELHPGAVIVGDSTRPTYYATWMWERPEPRRYFHSVSGYGTLGYALPAAIGAQLGVADPVIGIIGDGGLLFTLGELAVAVHEKLCVRLIVWDNSGYQEIAHSMAARQIDTGSTQYDAPDFAALAAGFGARFAAPGNVDEFKQALGEPLDGPQVIVLAEDLFVNGASGDWY